MHLHTVVALGEVDPIMFVVLFRFMIHVLENAGVPAVDQFSVLQRLRWSRSGCVVVGLPSRELAFVLTANFVLQIEVVSLPDSVAFCSVSLIITSVFGAFTFLLFKQVVALGWSHLT